MGADAAELLAGLSVAEPEASADGVLARARQGQLGEPLARNGDGRLSVADAGQLEQLLELADPLTVFKARARYTSARPAVGVTGPRARTCRPPFGDGFGSGSAAAAGTAGRPKR